MSVSPWLTVLLLSSAAAEPEKATASPCETGGTLESCLTLTLGAGVFGDYYPVSTVKAPGTSNGQRSLLGGARFWIGTRWPKRLALRGVFEIGYATVGPFPERGSDGLVEGAGLELSLDLFNLVKPYVRFMYNAIVARLPSSFRAAADDGVLKSNAFFFKAGAQISFVEVSLSIGRDLSGGIAPGFGLSVNWMY